MAVIRTTIQSWFDILGLLYLRASATYRAIPNVFILGASKSGTTSLANYLEKHPNYFPAVVKETKFLQELTFLRVHSSNSIFLKLWGRYSSELNSYRKFFPYNFLMERTKKITQYQTYTGDHTPLYLYCPIAAQRVKAISPQAKLIIILRNPIDRAYSDFNMHKSRGYNEDRSFEQAINDELNNVSSELPPRTLYLQRGNYEFHIRQYMSLFQKDQLHIIKSEDFFENPNLVIEKMFEFLELPLIPIHHREIDNRGFYKKPMKETTRRLLQEHFQPLNQRLYSYLGKDFAWD